MTAKTHFRKKRTGYVFTLDSYDATITILRPFSGEHLEFGKYLVVYEDAHGEFSINSLTFGEIAEKYAIDHRELEDIV